MKLGDKHYEILKIHDFIDIFIKLIAIISSRMLCITETIAQIVPT